MAVGWISKIISGSVGETVEKIGNTVKQFVTPDGDRLKLKAEFEKIIQSRDTEVEETLRQELQAKERIIVAELQQSDLYTKRMRPTIGYTGLIMIVISYQIIPAIQLIMGVEIEPFPLPDIFWQAWGGLVGVYSIGRSLEKRGTKNKTVSVLTGT